MISKNRNSIKWVYLPVVISSAAILTTQLNAGEYQAQGAQQVQSIGHQYVGGRTRVGVSVTDEGDASADVSHVFSETQNSSTSGGLWAGFDLEGDDKGVDEGGVQVNHNWVSRDSRGVATHVNKAFAAYDRNSNDDAKVTVGYGQERRAGFWEGHVSKGISDKREVQAATATTKAVYEKAFDYGVGASVGKHLTGANARIRAGIDHQWAEEVAADEERAMLTTLSAGVDKYFHGTPHSVGLDVSASRAKGGYGSSDDTTTSASLNYNYEFGGGSIYQPDQRYRRVRVEVPGKGRAATYAKKPVYTKKPIYKNEPIYKNQPIYKKEPVYVNKTVRVPTGGTMAKSTVELEGQTFFKYGSAKLIPSAQQRLRQIAAEIRKHGYKGNIRITGNSCGLSNTQKDQALSEKRAATVRNFMIAQGFNPDHLKARGLGSSHPKYSVDNEDFKNRRVDIEYVTERQQRIAGGYRNETKRVQNGFRNVIAGYKRVQVGTKNVQVGVRNVQTGTTDIQVTAAVPGTPRVIWRTEPIATSPAWVTRALRSNFDHNRSVDTYRTTAGQDDFFTAPNTGPNAVDDKVECMTGESTTINVLSNDIDAESTVSIQSFDQTSVKGGSVVQSGDQLIYMPADGFEGDDSFTYTIVDAAGATSTATVYITVSGSGSSNSAPVAMDDSATTQEDESVLINVTSNDSDAESGVDITVFTQGAYGSVTNENGQLRYTPNAGFVGTDTFTYTIIDDAGNSATATVTVIVEAKGSANTAPDAVNDSAETTVDNSVMINVLGNDFDYDEGDLAVIKSFETTSVKGGTITSRSNQLVYTPAAGFVGTDSFTYVIEDMAGLTDTATVTIVVKSDGTTECNTTCTVANMDDELTSTNSAVTIDVLANDTGTGLNIVEVSQGENGHVSISGNKVTYTPATDFVGNDFFWYKIVDANGYATSNKVMVYVVNDTKM